MVKPAVLQDVFVDGAWCANLDCNQFFGDTVPSGCRLQRSFGLT